LVISLLFFLDRHFVGSTVPIRYFLNVRVIPNNTRSGQICKTAFGEFEIHEWTGIGVNTMLSLRSEATIVSWFSEYRVRILQQEHLFIDISSGNSLRETGEDRLRAFSLYGGNYYSSPEKHEEKK
jgi:hypothetical protein